MSLISRLYARMAELPPATHRQLVVQEDLRVPMPDGVELLADRVAPRRPEGERMPILLCRTPYGRRGLVGSGIAAALGFISPCPHIATSVAPPSPCVPHRSKAPGTTPLPPGGLRPA